MALILCIETSNFTTVQTINDSSKGPLVERRELNFRQNTGLNFCKTLGFWTVFYRTNHCALSKKRDKKTRHT